MAVLNISERDALIAQAQDASEKEQSNKAAAAKMRSAGYPQLAKFMADTAELYRKMKVNALIQISRIDRGLPPEGAGAASPHVAHTT